MFGGPALGETITVASVPAGHVYVRHVAPLSAGGAVRRLRDPHPDDPSREAEDRWWPPVMLRVDWVRSHAFDVLHIHFGYDAATTEELAALVAALEDIGRPLVITVHDLRNPHHPSPEVLERQLDVLVPAAAEILTLSAGAAEEIRNRWGRPATVVPHPHVVPLGDIDRIRGRRLVHGAGAPRVVGVACKSLRANADPARLLPALAEEVAQRSDTVLEVALHDDVWHSPQDARQQRFLDQLTGLRRRGLVRVRVHPEMSDEQLWDYLASLDVAVLPYRFGTHSGWLEACHDVGTTVLAPSLGHYSSQGADETFVADEVSVDHNSLRAGLARALDRREKRPLPGLDAGARASQRSAVAQLHEDRYRAAVDAARTDRRVGVAGPGRVMSE